MTADPILLVFFLILKTILVTLTATLLGLAIVFIPLYFVIKGLIKWKEKTTGKNTKKSQP